MTISPIHQTSEGAHLQGISPHSVIGKLQQEMSRVCKLFPQDLEGFKQGLETLSQKGNELMGTELNNSSITPMSLNSMIEALDQTFQNDQMSSQGSLYQAIAKAYQTFLSLIVYRSCVEKQTITLEQTQKNLDVLASYLNTSSTRYPAASFHQEYSKQLIHVLNLSPSSLSKNMLSSDSLEGVIQSMKALMHQEPQEQMWVVAVYELKCKSASIRSLEQFKQVIDPIKSSFEEKGSHYTLGLASVYEDLIKSSHTSTEVKQAAIEGLMDLSCLYDKQLFKSVRKGMSEEELKQVTAALIKSYDRYALTRTLIPELVKELKSHTLYAPIVSTYLDTQEMKEKIHQSMKQVEMEQQEFSKEKKELKAFINELEQFIQPTRDIYTQEEIDERQVEVKKAIAELIDARAESFELDEIIESIQNTLHSLRVFLRELS
ncbi:MAG: hypothetical protein QRY72_04195 [Candidatus Rhabdochlamydia sp.]